MASRIISAYVNPDRESEDDPFDPPRAGGETLPECIHSALPAARVSFTRDPKAANCGKPNWGRSDDVSRRHEQRACGAKLTRCGKLGRVGVGEHVCCCFLLSCLSVLQPFA